MYKTKKMERQMDGWMDGWMKERKERERGKNDKALKKCPFFLAYSSNALFILRL